MRKEYDFSNGIKNPYIKKLKRQITIRIDEESINYFQGLSRTVGIPYQNLINMYLKDCAKSKKKLEFKWG